MSQMQIEFSDESYYSYKSDGANFMNTNGPVGLIALPGTEAFVEKLNTELFNIRMRTIQRYPAFLNTEPGFIRQDYRISTSIVRFSSGEGKATINSTVRGHDIYIFCDVTNHFVTHKMFGMEVPTAPDDHYQNLKRTILACSGKARNISVVMPYLYEGRQDYRNSRESLDCANVLRELNFMGVKNIITFDPHDGRVENAIPRSGVENIPTSYRLLSALISDNPEINFNDPSKCMIISPDENGMKRAAYFASMLGLPLGTFYRERDYSTSINGRNPITNYKFLGDDINGKTAIIIDDMINSGTTVIQTAYRLKENLGAGNVIMLTTYPLLTGGTYSLDQAYKLGYINKIYGTNLCAHSQELLDAPWYRDVDMSVMSAELIDAMNHQASISGILDQSSQILQMLDKNKQIQSFLNLEGK